MPEAPDESLRLRLISAAILIPVALICVWAGGWVFFLLALFGTLLMVDEWDRLCGGTGLKSVFGTLQASVCGGGAVLAALDLYVASLLILAIGGIAIFTVARGFNRQPSWPAAGVIYLGLPAVALIWLRASTETEAGAMSGATMIVWLLAVLWALDTATIAVGRSIKGPKMAPTISPNKTWSGLIGGVVAAGLVGAIAASLWDIGVMPLVLLSAALGLISQGGDLIESAIKRHFGVKNSGNLIPGHGGILDRLDGLIVAAPVVALFALMNNGNLILWH